jgi:hypothetical protein
MVTNNNRVLVLGTGATIALTNKSDLSWSGFLLRMSKYALENAYCTSAQKSTLDDFQNSLSSSKSTANLTNVAKVIARIFKVSKNEGLYEVFLNETIAKLSLDHSSAESKYFLETIARHNCPILTTNYDDLIERGLGIRSLTLDNISCAAEALRSGEQCVIHLHGLYSHPESIILTDSDYSALLKNKSWKKFTNILTNRPLLFIGFGSSMFDSAFRRFRRAVYSDTPKTISYWNWILGQDEQRNLDSQIKAATKLGEKLPKINIYAPGPNKTKSICDYLNSQLEGQIVEAPRRVPIVSEFMTSIGHEIGFVSTGEVKLITNKGLWVRNNIKRLTERKIQENGSADIKIILCAPSYANFQSYLESDVDNPKLEFKKFVDEIVDSASEIILCKTKYKNVANIEVRLSENYHLLRIALFGENAYVTKLSKESSMLLRRSFVSGLGGDRYENEMLVFFDKYFKLLWDSCIEFDFNKLTSEGILHGSSSVDKIFYKMRSHSRRVAP